MANILAVYSIKGGVGKTSSAVNLAYQFSLEGKKVLLIDLDPQGASGFYFKIKPKKKFSSDVLIDKKESLLPFIRESDYNNLDVLPSKLGYRHLDTDLDNLKNNKDGLKKNLKELKKDYDIIVIDCPPNITLLSENVFSAANILLLPLIPSPLSERTFTQLKDFLNKKEFGKLKILPFFSMVEKRKKVHIETMVSLRNKNKNILETIIPRSADVEKMGINMSPVQCFAGRRISGTAFKELGQEILNKIGE
ncbi:MAG: ParA family protein [Spirochaetales bacterium]|nr:ParA family protein [Spirochaetales bacterium]